MLGHLPMWPANVNTDGLDEASLQASRMWCTRRTVAPLHEGVAGCEFVLLSAMHSPNTEVGAGVAIEYPKTRDMRHAYTTSMPPTSRFPSGPNKSPGPCCKCTHALPGCNKTSGDISPKVRQPLLAILVRIDVPRRHPSSTPPGLAGRGGAVHEDLLRRPLPRCWQAASARAATHCDLSDLTGEYPPCTYTARLRALCVAGTAQCSAARSRQSVHASQ